MNTLKNIFDNAAKQTIDSTYTWFDYPSDEQIKKQKEKSKPTIGDEIEEIKKKVKPIFKEIGEQIKPADELQSYMQNVRALMAQRVRLPGEVGIGGPTQPKMAGRLQAIPGSVGGLRAETFTDKINEVRARMRAFATDKYYSDITYGKS